MRPVTLRGLGISPTARQKGCTGGGTRTLSSSGTRVCAARVCRFGHSGRVRFPGHSRTDAGSPGRYAPGEFDGGLCPLFARGPRNAIALPPGCATFLHGRRARRRPSQASAPTRTITMKITLLTGAAVALGIALGPATRAGEPCFQSGHLLPFPVEPRTIVCYRTETRTELRPVPRTVCRQVEEQGFEEIKEKVLVQFWRTEERKKEVMIPEEKVEERSCPSLIVGCEDEKREKTVMMPQMRDEI